MSIDSNDNIIINGEIKSEYTFKQDYYWMMGDNRYKSEDSRSWGFVPEDHIVGKPVFIWFSIDGINDGFKNWKIRWNRVFTTVNLDGKPKSYRWHFLIALVIYLIFAEIKKKRKKFKLWSFKKKILIPPYFGPISHWMEIYDSKIFWDIHQNYEKQSYRNRTFIHSANGVLKLTVPIKHSINKFSLKIPL